MMRSISNKNDMQAYYELIENIEPESILDVGLFLQQIGTLSRHLFEKDIPENVRLDGTTDDIVFPIYRTVYDNIYGMKELLNSSLLYDLIICLDRLEPSMRQWVITHGKYMLVRGTATSLYREAYQVVDLNLDSDTYGLVLLKR